MHRLVVSFACATAFAAPMPVLAQTVKHEMLRAPCSKGTPITTRTDLGPVVDFRGEALKLLEKAEPALEKLRAPGQFSAPTMKAMADEVCSFGKRWVYLDERAGAAVRDHLGCIAALTSVESQVRLGLESEFRDLSPQGRGKMASSLAERIGLCRSGSKPST